MARKRQKQTPFSLKALQYGIVAIGVVALTVFLVQRVYGYFLHADLFLVKQIEKAPGLEFVQSSYLNRIVGQNIFQVDLRVLQSRLQSQYPEIDRLRILRKFPDTVCLLAQKRDPFAFLTFNQQDILIDRDGYVLSFKPLPVSKFPQITGLTGQYDFTLGKPVRSASLQAGLEILSSLKENAKLKDFEVTRVDVENLSKVILSTPAGVNIILDKDRVEQKLQVLGVLLAQGNVDLKSVNYIDLRFKEPILGNR